MPTTSEPSSSDVQQKIGDLFSGGDSYNIGIIDDAHGDSTDNQEVFVLSPMSNKGVSPEYPTEACFTDL